MQTIWNLVRKKVGLAIAAGLTLFGTDAAMATSVLFPYPTCSNKPPWKACSKTKFVPSTTLASEPDLAPSWPQQYPPVPFTIYNPKNPKQVECAGWLESMAVKPITPGQHYDFYYRIVTTSGSGRINWLTIYPIGPNYWIGVSQYIRGMDISVAYRSDKQGTVRPIFATRTTADKVPLYYHPLIWDVPIDTVAFGFVDRPISCATHEDSRFMLMRTPAFNSKSGAAVITTTTGNSVTLPTFVPF